MLKKDKYKMLREAGYSAKEASKKSSLGKHKFVEAVYEKGGKRKANKARKEAFKLTEKERQKAIDALPRKQRSTAKRMTDKKLVGTVREEAPEIYGRLAYSAGLGTAREVRHRKTEIEKKYKAKYVYIIKLFYTDGSEEYVNYSTDRPPEQISYSDIYTLIMKHVRYSYQKVLSYMDIETLLLPD